MDSDLNLLSFLYGKHAFDKNSAINIDKSFYNIEKIKEMKKYERIGEYRGNMYLKPVGKLLAISFLIERVRQKKFR